MKRTLRVCAIALTLLFASAGASFAADGGDTGDINCNPCTMGWPDYHCGKPPVDR